MPTYLSSDKNYWACDIEADNLLEDATRIWCCCVENVKTGERHAFTEAKEFLRWWQKDYVLVGHNFIAYDLPMLNRHWKTSIGVGSVVDTFVLSQLYNPSFAGGHSLEAWGKRLKFNKGSFNDFSKLSDEMLEYCQRDVHLTAILYRRLSARMVAVGFTEQGAEIEHLSWNIIQNKQRRHGFPFNKKKAEELLAELRQRRQELEDEIYKLWPPEFLPVRKFANARKKDGSFTKRYLEHRGQYPELRETDDGGYTAYDFVAFNLGSPPQRVAKLLELGWTPSQWNYSKKKVRNPQTRKFERVRTSPKVDEESVTAFAEISGRKEVAALAKWIVVNSRITNMLTPWLNAYNEKTGCIHGKLFINATLRYRHSDPNTANIPAVKVKKDELGKDRILLGEEGSWAYECRDLFNSGPSKDYVLVGVDAKGIQLRVLANYAYSDEFVESVLAGDPHTNNIKILGLANKAAAKKFLYTVLMGGGGERLAADQAQFGTRLTAKEGQGLRQKLIDGVPGFQELINDLQEELERTGRIRLCDGTPILVSSPHMVIPYLLQGDESRIMKLASILLDREIRRLKLDAKKVGDIHDEWQFVVRKDQIDAFIRAALDVFPKTGNAFGYRVPIEGDAKVGETWAETH